MSANIPNGDKTWAQFLTDLDLSAGGGGGEVTGDVSVLNFPGTQPVSGTVTATGPLTDTQLRATAVPVSGTVTASGPVTDTQLRASAVPVDPRPLVTKQVQPSSGLTTSATAYVAGDQLGAILTFTSMARASGGTGIITGAVLLDEADIVAGGVDLFFYDRSVTLATDNAAGPGVSDADAANLVGVISLPGPIDDVNNRILSQHSIAMPYDCNATSLFVAMVTRSAHSFFGAGTSLKLKLYYAKD